tara:strand:+ start:1079 stop:1294 length:216 start_codon:yes stop_codon:yes gene_type:complete
MTKPKIRILALIPLMAAELILVILFAIFATVFFLIEMLGFNRPERIRVIIHWIAIQGKKFPDFNWYFEVSK